MYIVIPKKIEKWVVTISAGVRFSLFLMIAVIVLLFDGKFSDVYYSSYKYTRIYIYYAEL